MNIALKKVELIEWLTKLEDHSILEQVELLKKKSISEGYETNLKPMTSYKFKSLLDQSESEYKNGKITS